MKSFLLLPLLSGFIRCDDHSNIEHTDDHSTTSITTYTSTTSASLTTYYSETDHIDHTSATSTHHSDSDHSLTTYAATTTHHPETDHSTSTFTSTHYSEPGDYSSTPGFSLTTGVITTTGKPSTGVICGNSISTATPTTTAFCPILSAHSIHTGMMGMMGSDLECPNWANSNFHYMMNGMDSNQMCCTFSATLTRVGSLLGCCPCGARCTGNLPQAQNWYSRAGQVVLTSGSIPASVTSATSGGSSSSAALGRGSLTNWPLAAGSIMFTLLLTVQAS